MIQDMCSNKLFIDHESEPNVYELRIGLGQIWYFVYIIELSHIFYIKTSNFFSSKYYHSMHSIPVSNGWYQID
jgi:hypothetical protein